jgi:putative ABC transport system permease protein
VSAAPTAQARRLMSPYALFWFYRRRLRVHGIQELLAGVGVAVAVALIFSTTLAAESVSGSAAEVVHTVTGPATLQLHARSPEGFSEALLARVERLPGVKQAAPLLEQTATVQGPTGTVTVDLAGADTSLVVLDGLAHTLPRATLAAGGIGLSTTSAAQIGVPSVLGGSGRSVTLLLAGRRTRLPVSAVLGPETLRALSQAAVAVMPLEELQRLSGLTHRITRVLVQPRPGHTAMVRAELRALARSRIDVAAADQDVRLLEQALRPSNQANAFFAAVSGLLGMLFAFNALLITAPERRRAIADLRMIGVKRSAIAQMLLFQALTLGMLASLVGLLAGYELAVHAFHASHRYLAEAFTLGSRTIVGAQPLVLALLGGVLAACLASAVPLLDMRRGRAIDAIYHDRGVPADALPGRVRVALVCACATLFAAAGALFAADRSQALPASCLLALSTLFAVPLTFACVLRLARAISDRCQRITTLPVVLSSLRATTFRSLALASTGAVALYGSVALGGARTDLLRGIQGFAAGYSADASVWVGSPGDNQAVVPFDAGQTAARIGRLPGVREVRSFQGSFVQIDGRRVWVLARPPGGARHVLESQILQGNAAQASLLLADGGWVVASRQIAEAQHTGIGGLLALPTPTGVSHLRIAATSTNLAWSPGVVFLGSSQYARLWGTRLPSALAVQLSPGASAASVRAEIERALGPGSGLQAITAGSRERNIDALTGEGLGQLRDISMLLELAAVLAMAAALTSAIWERRRGLAELRLSGVTPRRLRLILLLESALILGAGCLTGAAIGVYGQLVIDGYLESVTGFPVASLGTSLGPLATFAIVGGAVLAIVIVPGWLASRVSPRIAFNE